LRGSTQAEVTEEPAGGAIGAPPSGLGSGAMDGGTKDRGTEEEVSRITEGGRAEGPSKGPSQEGEQPEQSRGTDLTVGENAGSRSGPVGQWVLPSVGSSHCRGRKAAAAGIGVHTESSAASPSSTSSITGKGQGQEPPELSGSRQATACQVLESVGQRVFGKTPMLRRNLHRPTERMLWRWG
jgi:hypothetical protein